MTPGVFVVLGIEPRVSYLLGNCLSIGTCAHQPFIVGFFCYCCCCFLFFVFLFLKLFMFLLVMYLYVVPLILQLSPEKLELTSGRTFTFL